MRIRLVPAAVAVVVLAALPLVLSRAHTARLAETAAYVVVLVGLDVLVRGARRISLGHGAFMAVGGYTVALLAMRTGVPALAALPVAAAGGAVVGVLAAVPVVRRPGRYLALPTLGLALALPPVLAGYAPVVLPHAPGVPAVYTVAWVLAGCLLAAAPAARRRLAALPPFGVDACSGACAGAGGGLVVLLLGRAGPAMFPLHLSLLLVAAGALGIYAPLRLGAVLGAFALEYVPDLVGIERTGQAPATTAFGVALVLLTLLSPLALAAARRRRR